jgi:hypothetical protein
MSVAKYYHLFAGEVHFHTKESEDSIGSMKVNTMVTTFGPLVTAKDIAVAQQGMQQTFFGRMDKDAEVVVYDVFIISFSTMGKMTQEQFVKGLEDAQTGEAVGEREIAAKPVMGHADPFKIN